MSKSFKENFREKFYEKQNEIMENKQKENQQQKFNLRLEEIKIARLEAANEDINYDDALLQKQLPWFKRQLFLNIIGAVTALFFIGLLLLIGYLIGGVA